LAAVIWRRALTSILKITAKKKHPTLLSFVFQVTKPFHALPAPQLPPICEGVRAAVWCGGDLFCFAHDQEHGADALDLDGQFIKERFLVPQAEEAKEVGQQGARPLRALAWWALTGGFFGVWGVGLLLRKAFRLKILLARDTTSQASGSRPAEGQSDSASGTPTGAGGSTAASGGTDAQTTAPARFSEAEPTAAPSASGKGGGDDLDDLFQ
jgi:hypothetical protein